MSGPFSDLVGSKQTNGHVEKSNKEDSGRSRLAASVSAAHRHRALAAMVLIGAGFGRRMIWTTAASLEGPLGATRRSFDISAQR
jgi:hypothetical protein